ncbi:MAG: hypothetical protein AAB518_00080 [Patescibacteria group bacterium]
MKVYLISLLLIGFVAISVFGVFAMNHDNEEVSRHGCLAATTKGIDCPIEEAPIAYLAFHLGALKHFVAVSFSTVALLLHALVFLIVSIVLLSLSRKIGVSQSDLLYFRFPWLSPFNPVFARELTGWLALHENSPALT